ncbi:helix-turn-helix domain-containing protein [Streptomyces lavendulae]|uniref:helix-turn-helix domain-containing protein n=1 Tax=Streptomyces lavendulae TaxID=1914 RepID=UPI003714DC20
MEISRLFGVSLTTAQFARRALHTRRCAAQRRRIGGSHAAALAGGDGPLWRRVANDLLRRFDDDRSVHRVPTRAQLATQYGVSLHTVNRAVYALLDEGLLRTERGAVWVMRDRGGSLRR